MMHIFASKINFKSNGFANEFGCFVRQFPFVPEAKSDRKLSFVARYFITFIFFRKLSDFHYVASAIARQKCTIYTSKI